MGGVSGIIDIGNEYLTSLFLFFLGFAQLPIIGVSYSFCSELTYPVNEALSCGILQLFGSIFAVVLTSAVGVLLDNNKKYYAVGAMCGFVVSGAFFQLFVREILRRKRAGLKSSSFSFNIGNHGNVDEGTSREVQNNEPLKDQTENTPLIDPEYS